MSAPMAERPLRERIFRARVDRYDGRSLMGSETMLLCFTCRPTEGAHYTRLKRRGTGIPAHDGAKCALCGRT